MRKSFLRTLGFVMAGGIALFSLASCGKKTTTKKATTTTAKKTYATDTVTPQKEGYNILWSDEFNGDKLDDAIWDREVRPIGWTNNELQKYVTSEENGFVRDGNFVIKGIEFESGKYTSCKLRNQADHAFKYGRVEVSAKVPTGKGLWPAIWMMPKEESLYGQWPKCGEIDIMEVLGDNVEKAYGTLHWGEPHAEKQGTVTLTDGNTYANGFHEFAIEWEPGKIEWFIDGVSYLTVNDWFTAVDGGEEKPYPAPFNQDFCIQINLAIGGTWPGNPEPNADYIKDAEFEIDYVRVYQKTDGYDENVEKPKKEFRDPDATGNYITDSCFETPISSLDTGMQAAWFSHKEAGAKGVYEYEVIDGVNTLKVTIPEGKAGDLDYSVQIYHTMMPFIKGKTYKISFDYWASEETKINEVCVDAPNANWSRYWAKSLDLTTEKQHFEDTFTMEKKDDNGARFEFNMGNSKSNVTIYLTNIRVEEVTA